MEIRETDQNIRTPRGTFSVVNNTFEEMQEIGYGIHFSHNGYKIVTNGKRAYAVA